MAGSLSFILELRRRKVFRGIGYYLVGAWTLLQVAELLAEPAGLPPWTLTALLYLAVVLFPLAVWVAWRYELTDHGLVRTRPSTAADAGADYTLKVSDYVVLVAMLAVLGAIAWQGLGSIRSDAEQEQARVEQEAEAEREAVENSVAVLPFSDLSQNADQGFLGDGIADTVLHVLSQVKGLTISARTSSFAYRDRGMTIAEIARELGVAHVLEGSVQRAGDQMRVIARLVDARNNRELWSGNFDRATDEIFAVQDEIAREVVAALQGVVLADDIERLAEEYRPDLRAYELYVVARREMDRATLVDVDAAVQRLEEAIEIDPDYALAYATLARAYSLQSTMRSGAGANFEAVLAREKELLEKALDLDPTLAEAWNLQAAIYAQEKDFEGAEKANKRALELNPNSAEAWHGLWNLELLRGNNEAALDAIRKAVELDPESIRSQTSLAQQLFNMGRAEEAIYVLRENVRRHPESPSAYTLLARYLNQVGKPGEAMWFMQAARRRDPGNMFHFAQVCNQYWQLWDIEAAQKCMRDYLEQDPDNLDVRKWLAWLQDDDEEAARIARVEIEQRPMHWYPKMQLADTLAVLGQWDEIIEVVGGAFPDLLGENPRINDFTVWPARRLAEALVRTGRIEEGNRLIDAVLGHVARARKLQAGGWMAGPEDAMMYALRGEDDLALAALEDAIERDWSFYTLAVLEDSVFDGLRDDPRFIGLVDRLGRKMEDERAWYEEHKDELVL